VNLDGETVELEFITPGGRVEIRTLPVSQLKDKPVNESVIEKVESVRKDLAKFLISEVDKGEIVSVGYLLKYYHNIVGCQVIYNGKNSTALSVACQKGNLEMVKLLLKHGASVDVADKEQTGNKSIHHAVLGYCVKKCFTLLIAY
jgi:ankyrin repeat protein